MLIIYKRQTKDICKITSKMGEPVRRSTRILFDAVCKGKFETVECLLQRGSNVNGLDYDGNRAIHHAVLSRRADVVELLLKNGAEVDAKNKEGWRPYDMAIKLQDFTIIKLLINSGARVNLAHIDNALQEFPNDVKQLFYKNIDVHEESLCGLTALHRAVRCNDLCAVKAFLLKGADIHKPTSFDRYSPLHFAKSARCVEILLKEGADPNQKDLYYCTPLYTIAMNNRNEPAFRIERDEQVRMIETLLENGADAASLIFSGQVALEYGEDWYKMDGFRDALKFMAVVENKYKYLEDRLLGLDDPMNELGYFYCKCLYEIVELKGEPIYDNITCYDLLTKSMDELKKYCMNKKFMRPFQKKRKHYMNKFPLYYEIFSRRLNDAHEMIQLWHDAWVSLNHAIPCFQGNHIIIEKILKRLSGEDMQSLVSACEFN